MKSRWELVQGSLDYDFNNHLISSLNASVQVLTFSQVLKQEASYPLTGQVTHKLAGST